MGMGSSALTIYEHTMGRVYDNEFLTPADEDMITLPEILGDIRSAVWWNLRMPRKGLSPPVNR